MTSTDTDTDTVRTSLERQCAARIETGLTILSQSSTLDHSPKAIVKPVAIKLKPCISSAAYVKPIKEIKHKFWCTACHELPSSQWSMTPDAWHALFISVIRE